MTPRRRRAALTFIAHPPGIALAVISRVHLLLIRPIVPVLIQISADAVQALHMERHGRYVTEAKLSYVAGG